MYQKTTLIKIFWTFFRIGAFTLGGGYAMLPLIQKDIVETNNWLENDEFLDILAISQSVPGAIAVNSSIMIGYRLRGTAGIFPALAGVILPSLTIITMLTYLFTQFQNNSLVQSAFNGIRPAVVGLIAAAVTKLGRQVFKHARGITLFVIYLAISYFFNVHPILIIIFGAVSGPLFYRTKEKPPQDEVEQE